MPIEESEVLRPKAYVFDSHGHWESCPYLLQVLQTAKIVNIDASYRSNTMVSTEYSRPQNSAVMF